MRHQTPLAIIALLSLVALSACAAPPAAPARAKADTGLDRMERLTLNANRCWFKSKDPAFARYSLAPERSSFSGKPRFLLVPKGQPEASPLLVVEGLRGSARIDTYGPLTSEPLGGRVEADLARWTAGDNGCAA